MERRALRICLRKLRNLTNGRGKDLNPNREILEPLSHHGSICSLKRYQVHRGRAIEVGDGVMGWRHMVKKTGKKQQPDRNNIRQPLSTETILIVPIC